MKDIYVWGAVIIVAVIGLIIIAMTLGLYFILQLVIWNNRSNYYRT